MKEKKLYKIAFMGDKDHGCDIISTLESWGGSNDYLRTGSDPEYAYFINDLGTIDFIHNSALLSEVMKNFYFLFWHDYNIECQLKVGESINYGGRDYDVDNILFDANNRCIVYKLKSFGIGVEYITNNELTPVEEFSAEEENNMKRKLAIRGHATRGQEIIELLKMLGAKNNCGCTGDNLGLCYLIDNDFDICAHYFGYDDYEDGGLNIFTLEEFLEKYPYKVGNVIKFPNNMAEEIAEMKWDEELEDIIYTSVSGWIRPCHVPKNIENKTNMKENTILNMSAIDYNNGLVGYEIPEGYEFDTVIDNKVVLKKLKPTYPKTYVECCEVIANSKPYAMNNENKDIDFILQILKSLFICRNAYWQIAGEEMGLGKPWKPDWNEETNKFTISNKCNKIYLNNTAWYAEVLSFPTAEMRDAFYENFKNEIENCKELL